MFLFFHWNIQGHPVRQYVWLEIRDHLNFWTKKFSKLLITTYKKIHQLFPLSLRYAGKTMINASMHMQPFNSSLISSKLQEQVPPVPPIGF